MSIISIGLAENYAVLGSKYLFMEDVVDVKGFMGSNFLSYTPYVNADSNGIYLYSGIIPNAPIVNGAAALQAIADVTTAVGIMTGFITIPLPSDYNGIPINRPIIAPGDQTLNAILTASAPINDNINVYNITASLTPGNLTMSADVDFPVNSSTVCIFIVEGDIVIDHNITRAGILPQNVIFIANGFINIGTIVTVSGIYIGSLANIVESELTGRLISTDTINYGFVAINKSTVTAP